MKLTNKKSYWVFFGLVSVVAALSLVNAANDGKYASQSCSKCSGNDILAVPIQLGSEETGLAIIDARLNKIMIYEIGNKRSPANRMKLIAARDYTYDKLLEEYNNAEPTPKTIKTKIGSAINEQSNYKNEPIQEDIKNLVTQPTD